MDEDSLVIVIGLTAALLPIIVYLWWLSFSNKPVPRSEIIRNLLLLLVLAPVFFFVADFIFFFVSVMIYGFAP